MDRSKPRPVFLNLFQIHLPVGGIISIIHRLSGILLVFSIPVFIYLLGLSLENSESFLKVSHLLSTTTGKVLLLIWGGMLAQHFFSGIRHILLDIDIGVDKQAARLSAWICPILTFVFIILWGLLLW